MSTALDVAEFGWITRTRNWFERTWERIDRAMLRLQGRVDTPAYDKGLPYAFAVLQATLLVGIALARYYTLDLGAETAKFAQATWQIGTGFRPDTTLAGGNVLAEQGSLILYPLGGLTELFPRVETLLVVKALALAVAVIPLWRIARRHGRLGIGATAAIGFAYCIYAAVHAMNAADFAPAVLAVPFLMWAVLAGLEERKQVMTIAIVVVLCCRADLGLAVAGLGLLLLLERRRQVGVIALLLGFGWFLVAMYGLQPWLADGEYLALAPYSDFGTTPLRALGGIISSPIEFWRTVWSVENFVVVVSLLAPVLFLPLTAPRYLMPAVPLYVLYMGADIDPPGRLREAAQTVPITVFVFVATVFALQRSGRVLVKRVRVERRIVVALLLTAVIFFVRDSVTSPYEKPWLWPQRDEVDEGRLAAVDRLPDDDVPVRASVSILPLLAERYAIYELNTVIASPDAEVEVDRVELAVEAATADVDWILYDRRIEALDGEDIDLFRVRMIERGWQYERDDEAGLDVYFFLGEVPFGTVVTDADPDDAEFDDIGNGDPADEDPTG